MNASSSLLNFSLPKERRVLKKSDFQTILKSRPAFHSQNFRIYLLKTEDVQSPVLFKKIPASQIGYIIPKRYIPNAADRNYIKRVIKEVFRHSPNNDGRQQAHKIVFYLNKKIIKPKNKPQAAHLQQEITHALEKIERWINKLAKSSAPAEVHYNANVPADVHAHTSSPQ